MLLRAWAIYNVWGPQALDDYLDYLLPAWRWTVGLPEDIHPYRSPLLMWIYAGWLNLGSWLGIELPTHQIRWVLTLNGTLSLLAVVAAHWLTRDLASRRVAVIAPYLVAAHAMMPLSSTRAFTESFVIGLTALGVGAWMRSRSQAAMASTLAESSAIGAPKLNPTLNSSRESLGIWPWSTFSRADAWLVMGFFCLGAVTLVRFQMGLLYVVMMAVSLLQGRRRDFSYGFGVGLVVLALAIGIDLLYGRAPLQTLFSYLHFNSDQTDVGVMPWYETSVTLLLLLFAPFSFVFGRSWWKAIKANQEVSWLVFVFVLAHSINPHKEERFLLPILPLALVILAHAWGGSNLSGLRKWVWRLFFWPLNFLVLAISTSVNTQATLVGSFGTAEKLSTRVLHLDTDTHEVGRFISGFFVRPPSELLTILSPPDAQEIAKLFEDRPNLDAFIVKSGTSDQSRLLEPALAELRIGYDCSEVRRASSWTDEMLYRLNPEGNARRQAVLYFFCERQ